MCGKSSNRLLILDTGTVLSCQNSSTGHSQHFRKTHFVSAALQSIQQTPLLWNALCEPSMLKLRSECTLWSFWFFWTDCKTTLRLSGFSESCVGGPKLKCILRNPVSKFFPLISQPLRRKSCRHLFSYLLQNLTAHLVMKVLRRLVLFNSHGFCGWERLLPGSPITAFLETNCHWEKVWPPRHGRGFVWETKTSVI